MKKIWLSADEAAEYLQIKKSTLYFWTCKGRVPFYRIGGKKLAFLESELEEFVRINKRGKVQIVRGIEIED